MQGIIRTMRAERGFGFVRDAEGDNVYFHRSVVIPPERFVTLGIGRWWSSSGCWVPEGPGPPCSWLCLRPVDDRTLRRRLVKERTLREAPHPGAKRRW